MEKGKVLFIDTTHPKLPSMLEEAGFTVVHFYQKNSNELKNIASQFVGFIIRSKFKMDEDILQYASKLKFIGRVGAGMENIDTEYTDKKGIVCFNAPEGNRDAVGEQAIAMLLALFNNLLKADAEVRKGVWKREENRGIELGGKTIGIIGYGNTGGAFARKLSGFNVNVLAYDKYKSGFSDKYVKEAELKEIINEADIISFHVPLTDETLFMANESFFNSFRKEVYVINTSRGKVLNTNDLLKSLESEKVKGACLDVLEYEGLSFENLNSKDLPDGFVKLVNRRDVILSPHIAGWTHESNIKLSEVLARKIISKF
ncbi:MAG: hydroxyacid dehydrogenase [Marinilabiliales bacterium]|nr:MAG: hydroxyacid dehydrogenase [Marinilabiliales bacterium]